MQEILNYYRDGTEILGFSAVSVKPREILKTETKDWRNTKKSIHKWKGNRRCRCTEVTPA